jgi:hypothetical protein
MLGPCTLPTNRQPIGRAKEMAEQERENCDQRRHSGENRHGQERCQQIKQTGAEISRPALAQIKFKCVIGFIVNRQSIAANRGFRMMPKTLRLAGKRVDHAEKHRADHHPAKPPNDLVAGEFDEWHHLSLA